MENKHVEPNTLLNNILTQVVELYVPHPIIEKGQIKGQFLQTCWLGTVPLGFFKLNTDDLMLSNPGKANACGLIRDFNG